MLRSRRLLSWKIIRVLLVCFMLFGFIGTVPANSISLPSHGPQRSVSISVEYTIYEWWLLYWNSSKVVCQIYTEHESWPDSSEIQYYCGTFLQQQWLKTKACVYDDVISNPAECSGLYLHLASVTPSTRQVEVKLPPAEVFVSISGCEKAPGQSHCSSLPYLRFHAIEPLPNEQIIQVVGRYNSLNFSCPGGLCDLPLSPTGNDGVTLEFWAESSYGDASEIYTAQIRVIPWGDFANPDETPTDKPTYYVDVLSSQWEGEALSSCSSIWQAFTPVGGAPTWLDTPELSEQLVSSNDYFLLSGLLIQQGLVDASSCPSNGLEDNGAANSCGVSAAQPAVEAWQNQFDAEIMRVSEQTGVPAQLMKNIFSRESQFWPGIYPWVKEAGLGHLGDLGADTVLLWNPSFFGQFCPLVLAESTCQRGFGNLDLADQEMLRGALVQKVNAACPDCPVGVDLTQASFSISIFARGLLANCEQVGQVIFNNTGRKAGQVVNYEDLWKFTLLNYNAGPGCLGNAVQRTIINGNPLTWENVSYNLQEVCRGGIDYVEDISSMPQIESTDISDFFSTAEPAEYLPTPTYPATPIPTSTPWPTTTPANYPVGTQQPNPTQTYP